MPSEKESAASPGTAQQRPQDRGAHAGDTGNPYEAVTITNTTFTSLVFRIPGKSVRLGPREATEVPKAYLDTQELQALVRQGAVVVVTGSK